MPLVPRYDFVHDPPPVPSRPPVPHPHLIFLLTKNKLQIFFLQKINNKLVASIPWAICGSVNIHCVRKCLDVRRFPCWQ